MLHYFLTGDRLAHQAVLELGRFAIDSDDGARTVFRWLSRGPTGHPTASSPGFFGPGRASGNSLNALLDAWRLSGDERFLRQAELYIGRCIHPGDDFDAMDLLNPEDRWFYTMFLQRLGKYLDAKAEAGQVDDGYTYAQASLLAYAEWMAEHERPTLSKPEILEYPNETWAAQDMRKSEVFKYAAMHARDQPQRQRFLERSEFFFRDSIETLEQWKTRSLARPVVLMLSFGWMHTRFQQPSLPSAPQAQASSGFGRPQRFIPQKARALRNFKILVAAGAVVFAAGVAAVVVWLIWNGDPWLSGGPSG